MPLTYTNRVVRPGNGQHPSLIDIAVGLSRQPRFAGQTRRWWSVLDHVLFGDEIIKAHFGGVTYWRLAWLIHDAHEAITADVPTDVKGEELRSKQAWLDDEIFQAFFSGGYAGFGYWHEQVKRIDRICLLAEAEVVGPPVPAERILDLFGQSPEADKAASWLRSEMAFLRDPNTTRHYPIEYLGRPPSIGSQEDHPAVREYLNRMLELM